MKAKLLLVLFLFVSTLVVAQDNKKEVENRFMDYLNSISSQNFDRAMDYAPDELFEIVPRKQMIDMMEKLFNNPEMQVSFRDPKILNVGESEKVEGKHYILLRYSNIMAMRFDNSDAKTEEERKMRVDLLKMTFEKGFGEGKVKYNEETEFFDIYSEKDVYAVSKDGKTDWRFIVVDKDQKAMLNKLLPKQLVERIDFSKS